MSIYTTDTCFGCQATIERESGTYYCNACIAAQYAELSAERQAFEDFHAYADKVARNDTLAASADAIARTERLAGLS